jgi:hypothetical protein
MTYDSLGLHVTFDEGMASSGGGFHRMLFDQCEAVLRANGIKCAEFRDAGPITHYPCIEIEIHLVPLDRVRYIGDEMYYGTISFRRDVTMMVALRPVFAIGTTWSRTFGGQATNRFAILGEVEDKLKDFIVDYVETNSARGIWKRQ